MKVWAGLREAHKSQGSTPELARVGSCYQSQLNGKGKGYILEPGKTCRLRVKCLTRICGLRIVSLLLNNGQAEKELGGIKTCTSFSSYPLGSNQRLPLAGYDQKLWCKETQ